MDIKRRGCCVRLWLWCEESWPGSLWVGGKPRTETDPVSAQAGVRYSGVTASQQRYTKG